MSTEYELTLQDYMSIVRRRAPYLIGIFVLVFLIAIVFALTMPPSYRASGTIMVESQQLSGAALPNAIKTQLDDQLNIIKQRVMTRENLVKIANQYGLFKEKLGPLAPAELINKIRDRIVIETSASKDAAHSYQQEQQAIAFTLSFEARNPEVALHVTNDLISLFLDWNIKLRTGEATGTTAFFTQEANKLKIDVDRLEKSIADYKTQHRNALPEQVSVREGILTRAERDLREVERDYRDTQDELRSLEVELAAAKRGIGEENAFQTLPALEAELARISTIYNDSHPDIKRIKRKIELMEKTSDTPGLKTAAIEAQNKALNPAIHRIQARIDSDKARLLSLARRSELLQAKIDANEIAMTKSPKVEQALEMLLRDRDSAQKKYEEIRNKQMNAKIAESLESENKSGRFSVLEPPLLPEKPFKPDRVKILFLGFLLALAASGAAMMFLEAMDKRIRGIDALTHVLGYRPMVVIPYLPVDGDSARQKRLRTLAFGSIGALATLAVTGIYFV